MTTASNSRILRTIPVLLIVLLFCPLTCGNVIYVDDDAAGANDGTSWTKAYMCLQDALTNARFGDEIHVAKGIYKPDQHVVTVRSPHAVATGDRTATFQLKNGVPIKGGYAGINESYPDARDINLNQTILSGDLNGDDGPNFANNSENSYHVVTGNGTNETAVLDGFTITAGNSNGFYPHNSGAGIYNDGGSPTITNCEFTGNSGVNGGGMYNGGGSPTLTNCIFNSNLVSNMGGGMFNNSECNLTLINCTFSGNSAPSGGGMLNGKQGNATLVNCTFTRNNGYAIICEDSQVTVVNTILWNDSPFEIHLAGGSITVSYSDVRGGWSGTGNIDADPLFVDADGVDDVSGTEDDDLRLLPGSPCIESGDNSAIPQSVITDLDGNPRIINEIVDMGAYETYVAPIPHIYYVDAAAPGDNDGTSWSNAFLCLQDALAVARNGDEIRVAKGIYRPDQRAMMRRDQWQIVSSGDWTATFQLIDGVAIKGGYAGFGEPNPDTRDIERYRSILSGDLNADDGPEFANIWDNSYQVVTAGGTQWATVLDGFTITGGNADGPFPYNHGGGIYNVEGSPTLIDCTISGNTTTGYGGGMHNIKDSNPILVNCTFSNNEADYGGGIFNDVSDPSFLNCIFTGNSAYGGGGGGMCNYRSNPILANCEFIENSSVAGGGMFNEESEPMLSDCAFNRNSSTGSGGGMFNENGNPVLLSCIFSDNSAPRRSGGGMYNRSNSQPSMSNCIFTGNSAINGGAMDNIHTSSPILLNCTLCANVATQTDGGGISSFQDALPILINCILWGNSDQSGTGATSQISGSAQVSCSCVQNSLSSNPWPGEGNINADPFFADPENRDYHLKSQAGRWESTSQSWVIDPISSPCIDTGDPSISVGLERFPNGDRINMGAYGGTPEASLSSRQPKPLHGRASNPYPADGAVDVDINVILSWSPGFDGALHNIYLGTDFDHVSPSNFDSILVSQNQTSTTYDPGILDYNQTYYWRVDEVDNQDMVETGEVWSFTTISPPGPPKGRSCFTSETIVWMNGALIPISKASPGQSICLMNNLGKIQEVQEHNGTFTCYDVMLESGDRLSVAENHYFLAESGQWISLQNLKKGTRLKTAKGTVGIINIIRRPVPYTGKVYNLKVDGSDRYLVGQDGIVARDY